MIIDLHLHDRTVVVIGGGRQAEKRVRMFIKENCNCIVVVSDATTPDIEGWADDGRVELICDSVRDGYDLDFLSGYDPYVVVAATDDARINGIVLEDARVRGILAYSVDSPERSDFAHAAVVDCDMIQLAVFTGGRSPAVSKRIRDRMEENLHNIVTPQDMGHLKLQHMVRTLARDIISSPSERRECLYRIMEDSTINRLIDDGRQEDAEERAVSILEEWR